MTNDFIQLWIESKNKEYFLIGQHRCDVCRNYLEGVGVLFMDWRTKGSKIWLIHGGCKEKISKQVMGTTEVKTVLLLDKKPSNARPVLIRPPKLVSSSGLSVFDAALRENDSKIGSKTENYAINDMTVHAGRESWEGASIGAPDMKLLNEKDKELSEKEVLKLLEEYNETNA